MLVVPPATMVAPVGTVQEYPVIPVSVVYVTPLVPAHTEAKPVMVGIGTAVTVTL